MPITQPLYFLELSTGPLDPIAIKAVHLCTYSIADRCPAIALWRTDTSEIAFFPQDSADAEIIVAWASAQMISAHGKAQFLSIPGMLFALDQITTTLIDDEQAQVFLDGVALPFVFASASAITALRRYAGKETIRHRAVTYAS